MAAGPHPLQPDVHRGGEQDDYPQSLTNCNNNDCIDFERLGYDDALLVNDGQGSDEKSLNPF